MGISAFLSNFDWKKLSALYLIVEPYILKLIAREVPKNVTKLYENLAKYTEPALLSLFKLAEKVKKSPNKVDQECLKIGIQAIEEFANYLLLNVKTIKTIIE